MYSQPIHPFDFKAQKAEQERISALYEAQRQRFIKNPQEWVDFMIEVGIYNKDMTLNENYRPKEK